MSNLPLNRETLIAELASARTIIENWERVAKNEGAVPGYENTGFPQIDSPGHPEVFALVMSQMANELALASSKCAALAELVERAIA